MHPLLELARHPQSPSLLAGGVGDPGFADPVGQPEVNGQGGVDRHVKGQVRRIVLDHKHWPGGNVPALVDSVEVDQGYPLMHCLSKPFIVAMGRVGAAVFVAKKVA